MSLAARFFRYQEERFPIKILAFTTIAVVLSSAAVLAYKITLPEVILNYFSCLVFLLHVRVIDESRDFRHDNEFHPERPVQRGVISVRELFLIDLVVSPVFIFTCFYYRGPALSYGLALLLFSFVAWKDFFAGRFLRRFFYLYNGINMLQMVLLQLFIYAVFTGSYLITKVMWIHLLFVMFNTIIMEFVRKIRTSSEESAGKDTYSWHLGYKRSLYIFYFFSVVNFFTFIWMLYTISPAIKDYFLLSLLLMVLLSISVFLHLRNKKKSSENFLLLSTVLNYVGLNMLIYIFNF